MQVFPVYGSVHVLQRRISYLAQFPQPPFMAALAIEAVIAYIVVLTNEGLDNSKYVLT